MMQVLMSASYFKNIDSLFSPLYFPNDQDVLHTSMKTIGLVDSRLKFGALDCVITDVGSTRSRRKEWVPRFNGVDCIIFTAPLSGYDQYLIGDKSAVNSLPPTGLTAGILPKYADSLVIESSRREPFAIRLYFVSHMFQTIYRDPFTFEVGSLPRENFSFACQTVLSGLYRSR